MHTQVLPPDQSKLDDLLWSSTKLWYKGELWNVESWVFSFPEIFSYAYTSVRKYNIVS